MKLVLLVAVAASLMGCSTQREWYKNQGWTPDGFNYTLQRDRKTGEMSDYFGASWSLK